MGRSGGLKDNIQGFLCIYGWTILCVYEQEEYCAYKASSFRHLRKRCSELQYHLTGGMSLFRYIHLQETHVHIT